jgi:tellurite resistance protein TerC
VSRIALFLAFNLGVLAVLAVDLGIFHKKAHTVTVKEAAIWSAVWITLSRGFAGVIYWLHGPQSALEFVTG